MAGVPPVHYHVMFSEAPENLPEPLPTPEQIESSRSVIKRMVSKSTVRVGNSYVVKYGMGVEPCEGENMRFVRAQSDVPVPRLFGIYQRVNVFDKRVTYIIMEDIPGDTLESLWDKIGATNKSNIAERLQEAYACLRSIRHEGYFGNLGRSMYHGGFFWMDKPNPVFTGPFATEDDLIQGLLARYDHEAGDRLRNKGEYYRRVLPDVLRGDEEPVFTHQGLQPKNVMVKPDGSVVIIDWAEAGWYPSYWEYAVSMFCCGRWKNDWHAYVPDILEQEYPNHYVWINMIFLELWG